MKTNPEYLELLTLPQWKNKRLAILQRDGNKCCCCGGARNLNVHHRQYHINPKTQMMVPPWEYSKKYLITLCEKCHKAGHSKFSVPVFNINQN